MSSFATTSTPRVRLVEEQHTWDSRNGAREHHLLLVSPRELAHLLKHARRSQPDASAHLRSAGALGAAVNEQAQTAEPFQMRQRHVARNVVRQQQSLGAALARHDSKALLPGVSRSAEFEQHAVQRDPSGSRARNQRARQLLRTGVG